MNYELTFISHYSDGSVREKTEYFRAHSKVKKVQAISSLWLKFSLHYLIILLSETVYVTQVNMHLKNNGLTINKQK